MGTVAATLGFGDVLLSFGIFAAMLLTVAVLVRLRDNPAANFWLLVLLLASLAGMVLKFLDHNGMMASAPHLYRWNHPIGLCRPIALYLYLWHLLNPTRGPRRRDVLHFLPVVVLIAYLWPLYTLSAPEKIAVLRGEMYFPRAYMPRWYAAAGLAYSFAYWALSVRAYLTSGLRALGSRRSRKAQRMRRWVIGFLILSLSFLVLVAATFVAGAGPQLGYFFFQYLSILIVLACIVLLSSTRLASGEIAPRYEKSKLPAAERSAHAAAIRNLLDTEHLYRQSGLKMSALSKALDVPEHVLSQVINEEFGMSFHDLVNGYRVEAAKAMLRSGEHEVFTTEGIGREAGFGSRASFYSAFKRITGMTPAAYRKQDFR